MKVPEKRCQREPARRYGAWLKRSWARIVRHAARRDPEGAPRKLVTREWST